MPVETRNAKSDFPTRVETRQFIPPSNNVDHFSPRLFDSKRLSLLTTTDTITFFIECNKYLCYFTVVFFSDDENLSLSMMKILELNEIVLWPIANAILHAKRAIFSVDDDNNVWCVYMCDIFVSTAIYDIQWMANEWTRPQYVSFGMGSV